MSLCVISPVMQYFLLFEETSRDWPRRATPFLCFAKERKQRKATPLSPPASRVPKSDAIKTGSEINSPAAQTNFASVSVLIASLLASLKGDQLPPPPHPGPPLPGGNYFFFTLQTQARVNHEASCKVSNSASKVMNRTVPSRRGGSGWGGVLEVPPSGGAKRGSAETDKEAKFV